MTVDDLSLVVDHMKKQTGYVKTTNQELSKFNEGQASQNKWLRVLSLLLTVFLCVLSYGLWLDHQDAAALTAELVETNKRLDVVVEELSATHKATEATKKAVEAQPKITVKPADTSDPTSRPTLIVVPPPKRGRHHTKKGSRPKPAEFKLDPVREKKKK